MILMEILLLISIVAVFCTLILIPQVLVLIEYLGHWRAMGDSGGVHGDEVEWEKMEDIEIKW